VQREQRSNLDEAGAARLDAEPARLELHLLRAEALRLAGRPLEDAPALVLPHGGRDHARSWDWVARDLRRDHHVIAPDLRGHGDSSWAIGGHYTVAEFVLDIAQLLDTIDLFPVTIVGHSLGGAVALNYTAVYPDRVKKLVAIEGMGPPPEMLARYVGVPTWQRMHNWIEAMQKLAELRDQARRDA